MQIVFAHYHLNPGGVTQVILNQLQALATLPQAMRPARVGVLYGGRQDGWPAQLWQGEPALDVVLLPVPELDYCEGESPDASPLTEKVLRTLAAEHFTVEDTLLHIHNHALGKNVAWPGMVQALAERGYRLLLQVHDFAEDFRPANYRRLARAHGTDEPARLANELYLQSTGIHYATLTRRDAEILRQSGVADDRLHVLCNPVAEFHNLPSYEEVAGPGRKQLGIPGDAKLVLYPVRGIRRKNVGELLLHCCISPEDTWHAISLAPRNPVEIPSFERWKELAQELGLRALFDTCGSGKPAFLDTLAASDWLITTSVAEGFGMVFLETWLAGKQLVGRALPDLVAEFEQAGLRFDGLRQTFDVPLAWLPDRTELAEALRRAYVWVCESYGINPDPEQQNRARQLASEDQQTIDFALLPGKFQQHIIRHATTESRAARAELEIFNPGITTDWKHHAAADEQITANSAVVRSTYSLPVVGRRIHDVYEALAASRVGDWQPLSRGEAILQSFLDVDRLHAIRFQE